MQKFKVWKQQNRPVARAVTRSSLEQDIWGSNLEPVKSDTVLPTAHHRWDSSSRGAVLPTGRKTRKWASPNGYMLWGITASIMKDLNLKTAKQTMENFE